MAVNTATIKAKVKSLITAANTSTSDYDISSGLYKKVSLISGAYANKQPVLNVNYPAVFIELNTSSDDYAQLGNTSRREAEINIDIVSVIDYGIGQANAVESSDDELAILTQNIQDLFRANINLSSTVDSCLVTGVDYISEFAEDTYNSSSRMNLLIKKRG